MNRVGKCRGKQWQVSVKCESPFVERRRFFVASVPVVQIKGKDELINKKNVMELSAPLILR
jgi:hypothetical protein